MKRIYLFLLLAIPIVFVSCSSDDEKDDEQYAHYKDEIVGKWKTTGFDYKLDLYNTDPEIERQLEAMVKALINEALEDEDYSSEYWTFHDDNSFSIEDRYWGDFTTGSYQVKNNRVRIKIEGETSDWSDIIRLDWNRMELGADNSKVINDEIRENKKEIIEELMRNGFSKSTAEEVFAQLRVKYLAIYMTFDRVS